MAELGKVAFEAYAEAMNGIAYDGTTIPDWDQLKPEIKAGWEIAANAVHQTVGATSMEPTVNMKYYAEMVDLYKRMGRSKNLQTPELGRFFARAFAHLEDAISCMRTYVLTPDEIDASPRPK
jgi:hypothetical protein